ncbi:MAG: HEAT repeat domain-containing protein [Pseudomonadota bacterium]
MSYSQNIILGNEILRAPLETFEREMVNFTLNDKIYQIQHLNDTNDEESISKIFLFYLNGDRELRHEIRRSIHFGDKIFKTNYFISQLNSIDSEIKLTSIYLLGMLQERLATPYLLDILDPEDIISSTYIIEALGSINDPMAAGIVKHTLKSTNKKLLINSIKTLSKWTTNVSWRTFLKLLHHKDKDVRTEAAFALAMRKSPWSARHLLKAIKTEKDPKTRNSLIEFVGRIPTRKIVLPLIKIIVYDKDQRARLTATRTLDRVQGLIKPQILYKLRNISDIKLKSEIIFRIGKFGTDDEKHKQFLKEGLMQTSNQILLQSFIYSIGYLAEHSNIDMLMKFIQKDPLTSYNATWALCRTWRLEDKEKILSVMSQQILPMQKQIIIKFLIRRSGLSLSPDQILESVKMTLEREHNNNVRYLALALLEFSPSISTFEFLLSSHQKQLSHYEGDAIRLALTSLITHHSELLFIYIKNDDSKKYPLLLNFTPIVMKLQFYRLLSEAIFTKLSLENDEPTINSVCDQMTTIFFSKQRIARQFFKTMPDVKWKRLFLKKLYDLNDEKLIQSLLEELIEMLAVDDDEMRNILLKIITTHRDPRALPYLIKIAERDKFKESGTIAKTIVQTFLKEGII